MFNDLANALRQWLRTPVVTAVALGSLALGIGANLALFGLVDALLLKSLPVRDPQSLMRLAWDDTRFGATNVTLSTPAWQYLRDHQPFAESVLGIASDRVNLARGGEARYVPSLFVSGEALGVLGIEPRLGRTLVAADDRPGAAPAAVISHGLWQRDFAGSSEVIGAQIWLNNQAFMIVGVAPATFFGLEVGRGADVIVPLSADTTLRSGLAPRRPDMQWLTLYGRLKAGETFDQATAALRGWWPQLREATQPPGAPGAQYLNYAPYTTSGAQGTSFLRRQYEQPLAVLLAAVSLVLLIACANLSALVLARFTDRRHELGVRLALGAGRARLVRMLIAESLLLSSAGALLGIWFAGAAVTALVPYLALSYATTQTELNVSLDLRLVALATALALVSGLVAGLLPAWRASRVSPQVSLASSARGGLHGKKAARSMRVMVAAQVALSLMLVAGAALMARSFIGLTTAPTGVEPDRVLIAVVGGALEPAGGGNRFARLDAIRQALAAIPGIEAASGAVVTPLSGGISATALQVPGSLQTQNNDGVVINGSATAFAPFNRVLPGFFRVIGTPVIAGRDFDERDGPSAPPVAVVNQSFAKRHFGDGNPIGRTIVTSGKTLEIVGQVADSRQLSLKEAQSMGLAYGAFVQTPLPGPISALRFAVRTAQPNAVRAPVAETIRNIDPRLSIEFRTMRDEADATVNRERLMAWMAALFAALGLAMAVIGLYGTFTYAVARRRGEIGVRMAMGAARSDILTMVLREAGIVLASGTAIGLGGALASGRLLQSLLVGTSARDPWTLSLAIAGVTAAATLASIVPAQRASRIDPMSALREE